jgi:hypothetical protein
MFAQKSLLQFQTELPSEKLSWKQGLVIERIYAIADQGWRGIHTAD